MQVVAGALLSGDGRPIACEVLPGNVADAKVLLPVVDRARERFPLGEVCVVADRGMVSREVIQGLEARGVRYILGMRLRRDKEVREEVLSRPGRYRVVGENLRVKEVWVEGRRYILCYNPKEAEREAMERGLILETLREKYWMTKQAKIELFGEIVKRIHDELESRSLEDISTERLLDLFGRYCTHLEQEAGEPQPTYSEKAIQRASLTRELEF